MQAKIDSELLIACQEAATDERTPRAALLSDMLWQGITSSKQRIYERLNTAASVASQRTALHSAHCIPLRDT